jgi:phospholipid-binding lipoprotein MlaA
VIRGLRAILFAALALGAASTAVADAADPSTVDDPWEPFNRPMFQFNEKVDRYALEPVAKAWDFVFPDPVENAISRFMTNLRMPLVFANDVLQGKPVAALQDVARFAINTTSGFAGLFDPASAAGLPLHDEDFGQTLGVWGVPAGPYLMLPLLGPSSPRDATGTAVEATATIYTFFTPVWVGWAVSGTRAVSVVNWRSRNLETIAEERASAFDLYAALRNAHVQRRENLVRDRKPSKESEDDLYYQTDEVDDGN